MNSHDVLTNTPTNTPVIALKPSHLSLISKILDQIEGTRHIVSFDIIGLKMIILIRTALRFKNVIMKHTDRINDSLCKITIHASKDSVDIVQDMIQRCKENGMLVPIELCVQNDINTTTSSSFATSNIL